MIFKVATEDWEMDLIHQLNYRTFVEEIPQHAPSAARRLVDKFHADNNYLICLAGRKLAGMIALRAQRPFSLDQKLPDLDALLPPGRSLCEIRLLAVEPRYRTGQVFQGLLAMTWQYFIEHGHDTAVISGTTRQSKLYQHLGFIPFGPLVGREGARFQPMYLDIAAFEAGAREFLRTRASRQLTAANFLPGPVAVSRSVQRAFEQAAASHRTEEFLVDFQTTQHLLRDLAGAGNVEILLGSGTLANDAVAAQLTREQGGGVVVAGGEFGNRLADQARRFGLKFRTITQPPDCPVDMDLVRKTLAEHSPAWLWCVHCETSTGVLNDIAALKEVCAANGVKLCLDCISSLGTVPVDLRGVHLASCTSGKGLRSFPGLSMVFHHHTIPEEPRLPRYLDLGFYARHQGVAFTQSSNLVHALQAALKRVDWAKRFANLAEISAWARSKLRQMGFHVLGAEGEVSPAIITLALPPESSSIKMGARLRDAGFLLSCQSEHLRRQNWIQICLMGEFSHEKLVSLLNCLSRVTITGRPPHLGGIRCQSDHTFSARPALISPRREKV